MKWVINERCLDFPLLRVTCLISAKWVNLKFWITWNHISVSRTCRFYKKLNETNPIILSTGPVKSLKTGNQKDSWKWDIGSNGIGLDQIANGLSDKIPSRSNKFQCSNKSFDKMTPLTEIKWSHCFNKVRWSYWNQRIPLVWRIDSFIGFYAPIEPVESTGFNESFGIGLSRVGRFRSGVLRVRVSWVQFDVWYSSNILNQNLQRAAVAASQRQ